MHFFEGAAIVVGEATSVPRLRCHYRRGAAAPTGLARARGGLLRAATHYTGAAARSRGRRRTITEGAVSEHAGPSLKAFFLAARLASCASCARAFRPCKSREPKNLEGTGLWEGKVAFSKSQTSAKMLMSRLQLVIVPAQVRWGRKLECPTAARAHT